MKQLHKIIVILILTLILSCSSDGKLKEGYYFSNEEPYNLFIIKSDSLIFENCIETFKYRYKIQPNQNIISLYPFEKSDSVINLEFQMKMDTIKLLLGDTLVSFRLSSFDNSTDLFLSSKNMHIQVPIFGKPQFIAKQDLVVSLFIEMENNSIKLTLNEAQTNVSNLKNDLESVLNKFGDFERPFVTLRIFVDRDTKLIQMEPILKQTVGLFQQIAFVVKPSFNNYKRIESHYYAFFDRIYPDSILIKNPDKPFIEISIANSDTLYKFEKDLFERLKENKNSIVQLVLDGEMSIQKYIDTKGFVFLTIDSLRDSFSKSNYGCYFDELENEDNRKIITEKYPRFITEIIK